MHDLTYIYIYIKDTKMKHFFSTIITFDFASFCLDVLIQSGELTGHPRQHNTLVRVLDFPRNRVHDVPRNCNL